MLVLFDCSNIGIQVDRLKFFLCHPMFKVVRIQFLLPIVALLFGGSRRYATYEGKYGLGVPAAQPKYGYS
jgi:hypothetical protein